MKRTSPRWVLPSVDADSVARRIPDIVNTSRIEAVTLCSFDDDLKAHLFSHFGGRIDALLPEHRHMIVSSIENITSSDQIPVAGSPLTDPARYIERLGGDVPMLAERDQVIIIADTLREVERHAAQHQARLQEALTDRDKTELKRLLDTEIWSKWFLSHVLYPFVETHAVEIAEIGVDPELVKLQARSHTRAKTGSKPLLSGEMEQAPSPAPPAAPVPPPAPSAVDPLTRLGQPAPSAAHSVDRERTHWASTVRLGNSDLGPKELLAVLNAQSGNGLTIERALNEYKTLFSLIDLFDEAVGRDLGGIQVYFLAHRHPRNSDLAQQHNHPLADAYSAASDRRRNLVEKIAAEKAGDMLTGKWNEQLQKDMAAFGLGPAVPAAPPAPSVPPAAGAITPPGAPKPEAPKLPPIAPVSTPAPAAAISLSAPVPPPPPAAIAPAPVPAPPPVAASVPPPRPAPPIGGLSPTAHAAIAGPGFFSRLSADWSAYRERRLEARRRAVLLKNTRAVARSVPTKLRSPGGGPLKLMWYGTMFLLGGALLVGIEQRWPKFESDWDRLLVGRVGALSVVTPKNAVATAFFTFAEAKQPRLVRGQRPVLQFGTQYFVVADRGEVLSLGVRNQQGTVTTIWVRSSEVDGVQ